MLFFSNLKKWIFYLSYIFNIFFLKKIILKNITFKYIKINLDLLKKFSYLFCYSSFFELLQNVNYLEFLQFYKFCSYLFSQYMYFKQFKKQILNLSKIFYKKYSSFLKKKLLFLMLYKSENNNFFKTYTNIFKLNYLILIVPYAKFTIINDIFLYFQKQKLKRKFFLKNLVQSFFNFIRIKNHIIKGIYIKGTGRFTRRQRSSLYKYNFGKIEFRTFFSFVHLSSLNVITKYGKCTILLYLNYNLRFLKNKQLLFFYT